MRAPVAAEPLARPREHLAHVRDGRRDGGELLELRAGRVRDDARQRRLARSRRPVEDERRHAVALDREPQRAARADDVLLADELVERRGPQPLRERRDLVQPPAGGLAEEVSHARKYAPARWCRARRPTSGLRRCSSRSRTSSCEQLAPQPGERWLDLVTGTRRDRALALRAPGRT